MEYWRGVDKARWRNGISYLRPRVSRPKGTWGSRDLINITTRSRNSIRSVVSSLRFHSLFLEDDVACQLILLRYSEAAPFASLLAWSSQEKIMTLELINPSPLERASERTRTIFRFDNIVRSRVLISRSRGSRLHSRRHGWKYDT